MHSNKSTHCAKRPHSLGVQSMHQINSKRTNCSSTRFDNFSFSSTRFDSSNTDKHIFKVRLKFHLLRHHTKI